MAKTEHVAEYNSFTIGDRLMCLIAALLSVAAIFIMCGTAWFQKIKSFGYWDKPLKNFEE